jgi:erythronate-4-phosphate dehydrogenase
VWEGEPKFDPSLLELVDIGTPHIAGTASDGKIRATEMTRAALCRFFGLRASKDMDSLYPQSSLLRPEPESGSENQHGVLSVLLQAFDILKADADLRDLAGSSINYAAASFERLRTEYPLRPEFRHFAVELDKRHIDLAGTFTALGFQVVELGQTAPI